MIRVLVVDDHDLVRDGVIAAIEATDDMHVVGDCANGEQAVRKAQVTCPDVVLMDLSMPVLDGVEATRRIVSQDSNVRVVILTSASGGRRVDEARVAGAVGCVYKDAAISDMLDSVRRAAHSLTLGGGFPL